jgi:septal ring factor EnvC (AmiA/AmiB activator)
MILFLAAFAWCAPPLAEQLSELRKQMSAIEKSIEETNGSRRAVRHQLDRIRALKVLQAKEKHITEKRIGLLNAELSGIRLKRNEVQSRLDSARVKLKHELSDLALAVTTADSTSTHARAFMLGRWAQLRFKDFESLRADVEDTLSFELKIQEEKSQLEELRSSIVETEDLLKFHESLREELSEEKQKERISKLEEYRKLRESSLETEQLLKDFHERQVSQRQKARAKLLQLSPTFQWAWPVVGSLVRGFGLQKDESTGLQYFRKGIEIRPKPGKWLVRASAAGTVQFIGKLPGRGRVIILAHSGDFYSVYGQLASIQVSSGSVVEAGRTLAELSKDYPALYFEIRSRNLALNPLKWLQGEAQQ